MIASVMCRVLHLGDCKSTALTQPFCSSIPHPPSLVLQLRALPTSGQGVDSSHQLHLDTPDIHDYVKVASKRVVKCFSLNAREYARDETRPSAYI